MIFKTLNGDLTVFNKTLISTKDHLKALQTVNATVYNKNGAFNLRGLLVSSSQSVSTFTKLNNAFKAYNGNLSKSTQLQNAYVQAVGKQNVTLGNYLAGLNGAKASLGGYIKFLVATKAASIGLQVASVALNTAISMGITLAISALVSQISKWIHAQEEARQKAIELTNSYKEQKDSLDSQIEKYKELKETLDNGNLSTDETRSIKEQLLEIQKSLIESYGDEASNIDLVNGKYREQLGLLSELSKEKADEYVKENRSAYEDAKKELEKVRTYKIGSIFSYNGRDGMSDAQKQLYDYIKSYSELFEIRSMYDTSTFNNSDYAPTLFVNANADEAKLLIDQFYDDIEKYIKENNLELDYDSLQIDLSKVSSNIETNDALKEYREIYDEFMKAEVVRNDALRPLYQQSIKAVEDYNNALSSGEGIDEAKANLDSVQQSVQNATSELEGSQEVFDGIYDGVNKNAEATYQMSQAFENDEAVKGYAEQLKGLTDIDLKAINFEDNVQSPGEEAFKALIDILGLSEDEVQNLIDKLVELGYVQGEVQSSTSNFENPISLSISQTIDQLNTQLKPAFDSLKSAYQDIFTDDGFTLENVDLSMLDSIKSSIDDLNSLEGVDINIDYSSFENLATVLTNTASTEEEVHEAINTLATDIVSALNPAISECSGEAYQMVQALLESLGVMNSEEVMVSALGYTYDEYIAAKEAAASAGIDLANSTIEDIMSFANEANAAEEDKIALLNYYQYKIIASGATIDTLGDVQALIEEYNQLGLNCEKLKEYLALKGAGAGSGVDVKYRGYGNSTEGYNTGATYSPTKVDFKPKSGAKKSGGGKKDKKTEEEFDWIEKKIENLEDEISRLDKVADSAYSSIAEKNEALAGSMEKINEEINLQQQAYERYMQKAESVGLSDEYKALVQNGSVNIEEITDQNLQEAISNYTEWYDKVKETQDKINDLHEAAKDKHVEGYELELEELERLRDDQTITEREYLDEMLILYEKYYADQVEFANQAKEAKLKYLKEEKDYLETVANAAASLLDDEIDALEADKDKAREKYEKQIESIEIVIKERQKEIEVIQDQIDALEDENDEIDRQQKLQKALYDQQRALNQKSQLTYKDGQMSYDIDYSALKDADNDVREAQKDITIANLQKQIDSIQDGIDELEVQKTKLEELADESDAYFDAKIKNLQDYQNKWKEVTEFEERAIAIENLQSMFGEDAVAQILSGNTQLISDFCQEYVDTMAAIDLVNSGAISSITSEWEKLSGVSVNMEHARELSELSMDALSSKAESLGITMQTVQDSSKNMEDSLNNTDTSKINEQLQSTGNEAISMKEHVNSVVNELNNLATEVSAYEIPPINTEQFTSSLGIENNSGILGQLNSFIEKFREICEAIPSIWNGAMSSISRQGSVPGESVGYDALFVPLINAMDSTKTEINNKLKEYANLWTDFNKTLGEIIGTGGGGGTDKGGKDSSGKKGANLTGSPDGANKGANKEGGSDSIVGTIESGGEAVTQSLNEVWVPGFESFATRVDEICMSVCSMMEDMANEVIDMVNAALKALKELEAKNTGAYKIKKVSSSYSSHPVMASNAYGTLSSATGRGAITKDQESIVNELGNEMIARDGVLHEIQGGTQKVQLKKGDVVFNHKQTQELKKYNRVKSGGGRGKLIGSFAHGSASTKSIDIKNIENGIAGLFNDDLFKKVIDMLEKLKTSQDTIIQQNKDKTYPEGTIVTSDGQVLTPLPDDHPLIQLQKKFDNFMQQMDGIEVLNINAMAKYSKQMDEMVRQINNVNTITNNRNIQPVISGGINITCPGITSQEVARQVGVELNNMFSGIHLDAEQYIRMR